MSYAAWIALLALLGRRCGEQRSLAFGIFAGLLGWFVQGFGEFSLYVPALAWTAFCLGAGFVAEFKSNRQRPADG